MRIVAPHRLIDPGKVDVHSFWSHVRVPSDPDACWIWTGSINGNGYGAARLRTHVGQVGAHRVSLVLATGIDRADMFALHSCHVPLCVNPGHLRWGTVFENSDDKFAAGRQPIGEKHPRARLTNQDVRDIRAALASGEYQRPIAKRYGVTQAAISLIATGRNWRLVA